VAGRRAGEISRVNARLDSPHIYKRHDPQSPRPWAVPEKKGNTAGATLRGSSRERGACGVAPLQSSAWGDTPDMRLHSFGTSPSACGGRVLFVESVDEVLLRRGAAEETVIEVVFLHLIVCLVGGPAIVRNSIDCRQRARAVR